MAIEEHDKSRLRKLTLSHIAAELEQDLNGEKIMKEVWEECDSVDEQKYVEEIMREVIAILRGMI